jgi:hypothetical protein
MKKNNVINFKNINDNSKKTDPWCKPIVADTGNRVSGGAGRNVRIKRAGGMENIISDACNYVLNNVNQYHIKSS